MKGGYRPKPIVFKFPFRGGKGRLGTGSYNRPAPGGRAPSIKQFSRMKPGRPKPKQ